MPGLPGTDHRAIRLDCINVATFNPDVLRLVDWLLHDDRLLHDNGLLHNDRRRSHDDGRRSHDGRRRRRRYCSCDKPAEKRAANDTGSNRTAAAVVVMVVVARANWRV